MQNMLIYETPHASSKDPLQPAYAFLADPDSPPDEEKEYITRYRRHLLGSALGLLCKGTIIPGLDNNEFLNSLCDPEEAVVLNRHKQTFKYIIRNGSLGAEFRAQQFFNRATVGEITTAALQQEIELLRDFELGQDEQWITSEGIQAYSPHERYNNGLVACHEDSIRERANKWGGATADAIEDEALTHIAFMYNIETLPSEQTPGYRCVGKYAILGTISENGFRPSFNPAVRDLDTSHMI